jgi:hypothetical protein
VTGMSGTGESSALAELGQRGYRVVDTDHPGWREYREYVDSSDEARRGEWLWVEERITGLLDSEDGRTLFVQGCVRNRDLWARLCCCWSAFRQQLEDWLCISGTDGDEPFWALRRHLRSSSSW